MKKTILSFIAILFIAVLLFSCDGNSGGKAITEDIVISTTWTGNVNIDGRINVNAALIIEPGTKIYFSKGSSLTICSGGSLKAEGTPDKGIIFTSAEVKPGAGDWCGIELDESANSGATSLAYCTIEYAGNSQGFKAAVYVHNNTISMRNCIVTKSAGTGVYVRENGSFTAFSSNQINECASYPMSIPSNAVGKVEVSNQLTSSLGVFINTELYTRKDTWQNLGLPYVIEILIVERDGELILAPGVVMSFKEDGYLSIGNNSAGKITAIGTKEKPIIFTSNNANKAAGDWRGIEIYEFAAANSVISNSVVEYGGKSTGFSSNIYIYLSSPTISNTIVKNSAGMGIYNRDGGFTKMENNTISECADYVISVPAKSAYKISPNNLLTGKGVCVNNEYTVGKITWEALTVPYIIEYGLSIENNSELTIAPGTIVKMKEDSFIDIGENSAGKLIAIGSVEKPISFVSAVSNPYQGDWRGFEIFEYVMPDTKLSNCNIANGGKSSGYGFNIYIYHNGNRVTVENCDISFSAGSGIGVRESIPNLINNTYHDNLGSDVYYYE